MLLLLFFLIEFWILQASVGLSHFTFFLKKNEPLFVLILQEHAGWIPGWIDFMGLFTSMEVRIFVVFYKIMRYAFDMILPCARRCRRRHRQGLQLEFSPTSRCGC